MMEAGKGLTLGGAVQGAGSDTDRQGSIDAPGISAETVGVKSVVMLPELDGLVP